MTTHTQTWYLAQPIAPGWHIYVASGEQVEADVAPLHASPWAPPETEGDAVAYLDNGIWRVLADLRHLPIEVLRGMAHRAARTIFHDAVLRLSGGYPADERASWDQQAAEARLVLAGGEPPALLATLAAARGKDVMALAQSIVTKADARAVHYAGLLAAFQSQRDAIETATSLNTLPPFTLQQLQG